jgi:hypothetical protein
MTTTDWIINITLVLLVFRQIREARMDAKFVLIPLALVAYSAHMYLHTVPTDGNDLVLVAILAGIGAALGVAGGLTTHIRADGQHAYIRAGYWAAGLWVGGMGARIGFYLYSEHGGGPSIVHFSAAHNITSSDAWLAGLIFMALVEVISRLGVVVARGIIAARTATAAQPDVSTYLVAA